MWRKQVVLDWKIKYNCDPIGFETLVKPPRNGAVYRADNWFYGGMTKGYTARVPKHGVRVWYRTEPRLIFFKMI